MFGCQWRTQRGAKGAMAPSNGCAKKWGRGKKEMFAVKLAGKF